VTEDHLSFDGNCGVRAEPWNLPAAGDPTVYGPPFPLTSLSLTSAVRRCRKPHATSWPRTRATEHTAAAKPCKLTLARHFQLPWWCWCCNCVVLVLLSVAVVLLALLLRLGRAARRCL
jgi:hypothetical protein